MQIIINLPKCGEICNVKDAQENLKKIQIVEIFEVKYKAIEGKQ